jgi:hypothetical protein
MSSNMSLQGYDLQYAVSKIADPQWPDCSFGELLRIAFRDCIIDNFDHSVLKELRAER